MKRLIILFAICIITLNSIGQLTPQQRLNYELKVKSYENMKSNGASLAVGGIVVTGAGVILLINGFSNLDNSYSSGVSKAFLGEILVLVGMPMFVAGIVLNTTGNRKMKEYQ